MSAAHTPGPWRWELIERSKILHLVGGKPTYDLTIMDFHRWGMHRSGVSFRDTAHDGMNIMHKLQNRRDWIAPFEGREHHASWCANVVHPDAVLIAAAPELLAALKELDAATDRQRRCGQPISDAQKKARAAIAQATGVQP